MRARILTVATLFVAFAGVMAAKAADSQLLSLVMPDAKVLAGVNVDQAKASPLGLFVLGANAGNHPELQQLIALTGFDPSRDVHELLAATAGTGSHDGLMLARGNFDPAKILAAATAAGAVTESYGGATIIEDPKKTGGMVFLDSTLVIAGGIAEVEAAIDHHSGQSLPAAVIDQANQWSASEDAWTFSTVPPSTLFPQTPSSGLGGNVQGVLSRSGKRARASSMAPLWRSQFNYRPIPHKMPRRWPPHCNSWRTWPRCRRARGTGTPRSRPWRKG